MKKCKIIIMAALAVFAVAALAGCGNADNEETGSNPVRIMELLSR